MSTWHHTSDARSATGLRGAVAVAWSCITSSAVLAGRICLTVSRGWCCAADVITHCTIKGFRVTRTYRAAQYCQLRKKRTVRSMCSCSHRSSESGHCPTINAQYPMRFSQTD